jgi:hypothetical protein
MKKWGEFILCIVVMASCKKPYNPGVINSPNSYLVVEGIINSGSDSTIIKLSRTVNLSNATTINPLPGATLTVEGDQNTSYPLKETVHGTYVSPGLNLDNSHKYRLRIKTQDSRQYVSDFVAVLNSPPIDSISYKITPDGLNIYSNTHDPHNNARYYRWDYQETWLFHSNFASYFKSDGITIQTRNLINDNIYTCWSSDTSSVIILGSSAKLSQDVISDNPITFIPSSSEKLAVKYSILVKQYALTGDAYLFWQNLKKNTEQLGSIFDAQPTQTPGNIHSVTNPLETVIGYISVGSVSSERIFIANQQLPAWSASATYPNCKLDSLYYQYAVPPTFKDTVNQVAIFLVSNGNPIELVVNALPTPPGRPVPIGYTGAVPECVDCTLR